VEGAEPEVICDDEQDSECPKPLDVGAKRRAAGIVVGTSFRSSRLRRCPFAPPVHAGGARRRLGLGLLADGLFGLRTTGRASR